MIPLIVCLGEGGPVVGQSLGSAVLRIDPATSRLGLLFHLGFWGGLSTYKAGGLVGFVQDKRGSWASTPINIPPDPGMKGSVAWMQGIVVGVGGTLIESSNVVRLTLN